MEQCNEDLCSFGHDEIGKKNKQLFAIYKLVGNFLLIVPSMPLSVTGIKVEGEHKEQRT